MPTELTSADAESVLPFGIGLDVACGEAVGVGVGDGALVGVGVAVEGATGTAVGVAAGDDVFTGVGPDVGAVVGVEDGAPPCGLAVGEATGLELDGALGATAGEPEPAAAGVGVIAEGDADADTLGVATAVAPDADGCTFADAGATLGTDDPPLQPASPIASASIVPKRGWYSWRPRSIARSSLGSARLIVRELLEDDAKNPEGGHNMNIGIEHDKIKSMTDAPLLVVHVLEAALGGTRRYLENVVAASTSSAWKSALIYSDRRADSAFAKTLELCRSAGWSTFCLPMRSAVGTHDFVDAIALRRLLTTLRPDIVHAHSSKAGALIRLALANVRKRPRVFYSPHAIATARAYLFAEKLLAKLMPATFVAVSDSEREQLASLRIDLRNGLETVYPTIDGDYFYPRDRNAARARLGLRPEERVVLGIGRMVEQKNPLDFLRVVSILREQIDDVRAIWIGEGELTVPFRSAISALGLDGVVTVKPWSADVRDDIASCNVVLSTAHFESFGFVVAEAMSMGQPVVASAVTGTLDVMAGPWRDLTYAPGDLPGAAARVASLLNLPADARLRADARSWILDNFSLTRMSETLKRIYL